MQLQDISITLQSKTITDTFTATSLSQPTLGSTITRKFLGNTFSFIIDRYVFNPMDWRYQISGTYDVSDKLNKDVRASDFSVTATAIDIAGGIISSMGKAFDFNFDDFTPTGLKYYNSTTEKYECSETYASMLQKIFGWTDIVPSTLVNVFERGDTIYALQRGNETGTVTIEGKKVQYGSVIYERSLLHLLYDSDKAYYLSGSLNDSIAKNSKDTTEGEALISGVFTDAKNQMTLSYTYGLLMSEVFASTDGLVNSTTKYTYDKMYPPASLLSKTVTRTETQDTTLPTLTTAMLPYKLVTKIVNTSTLMNTLADNGLDLIQSTEDIVTEKTGYYVTDINGTQGDSFDDAESHSNMTQYSDMGQGQWCVTTYKDKKLTGSQVITGNPGSKASPYAIKYYSSYASKRGGKVSARKVALPGKFTGTMSINVSDSTTLERIANAIKNMNGKTLEKVSLVYLGTSFCDFLNKYTFNGNTYYLESNTISETPAGGAQQALRLIRWY
jgi:hypothetical protein